MNIFVTEENVENKGEFSVAVIVNNVASVVTISEGDGCNLFEDDIKNGFTDYIYYTIHSIDCEELIEEDGGMILLKEDYRGLPLKHIVEKVMDMAGYPDNTVVYPIV